MNDNSKGQLIILAVDDDEAVRRTAVVMISKLGYNVLEAKDGRSALNILGQNGSGIGLVFNDVFMLSGMDGFELAQELQRRQPHIKILLTSGFPGMVLNQGGIHRTGFRLLPKPYTMAALADALLQVLDQ